MGLKGRNYKKQKQILIKNLEPNIQVINSFYNIFNGWIELILPI